MLTAIGASGVPSGSIPLLIPVLETVGVPGEGIALVLGVDRILDMARTVPNVTGDLLASMVVARSEGVLPVPGAAAEVPGGWPGAAPGGVPAPEPLAGVGAFAPAQGYVWEAGDVAVATASAPAGAATTPVS